MFPFFLCLFQHQCHHRWYCRWCLWFTFLDSFIHSLILLLFLLYFIAFHYFGTCIFDRLHYSHYISCQLLSSSSIGLIVGRKNKHRDLNVLLDEQIDVNEFSFKYREIPFDELMMKSELGKGASGRVYKGIWRNVPVAIKSISLTFQQESALAEWRKELEIMTRLGNHPAILPFIGACTTQRSVLLIITKLCDLGSLYSYLIEKKKALIVDQLFSILLQSSSAVAYLHAENVVHRDIAARNFLLCSPFQLYLADFGMSRFLSADNSTQKTKNHLGPVRWMAPESIFSAEYSKSSDVYMYGMFLYEVFHRTVPFSELENVLDVADIIQDGKRPILAADCPHLSLFHQCWATNPAERPTMIHILEQFKLSSESYPILNSPSSNSLN